MADSDAPGWDAIDAVLDRAYPEQEPLHWGTIIRWSLGGPDPLDGASAYDAGDHWHYVSYGLTELYDKSFEDRDRSGWGFELSFRLDKGTAPDAPPVWPVSLMQNLARYVFETGNVLSPGDHMDCNGPLALGVDTALTAILVAHDPGLPRRVDSPHGAFGFHQIVGITADELAAVHSWNGVGMAELIAARAAQLVSRMDRDSFLHDASFVAALEAGRQRDGSSTGMTLLDQLDVGEEEGITVVTFGAIAVPSICDVLPFRIPYGRSYSLLSGDRAVTFAPCGDAAPGAARDDEGNLVLSTSEAAATAIAQTLVAKRGDHRIAELPGVVFRVVPTEVKSADGHIVDTIG